MSQLFSSLSNSSRGSLGTSSTASHKIKRGIAQIALDCAKQSMGVNLNVLDGDYFPNLQIGTNEKEALNNPNALALVRIHYCQRGLKEFTNLRLLLSEDSGSSNVSQAQADKVKQMRGLLNHDYLVIELQKGDSSMLYILAHKLGRSSSSEVTSEAGIYISSIPAQELPFTLHEGVRVHSIDCRKKFIPLDKLMIILQKEDPNYSLRNNNCWDYAFATTKWLVMECIRLEVEDKAEKDRLQREVDDLEANLNKKQMFSTAKMILEMGTNVILSR